ncbi:MAG TPA: glucose-6-phosphate dehydrogenase [Tepidisphaeraceae bacterium]|nr:glucose-6-phosphate dehydrogenase [Tepidisphaeraceae bacterium]
MPQAAQCAIVIFGASGDLSQLKLVPAIYELVREGLLSEKFALIGYARSNQKKDGTPLNDQTYRNDCYEAIKKNARHKPIDEALWKRIQDKIYYVAGAYDGVDDHARLAAALAKADQAHQCGGNRLYYISTPPDAFEGIISRLGERLKSDPATGWKHLIIEKPFGRDLASAIHLNEVLHKYWTEDQVFRIDHYLGKEALQNMMVMRFANSIFEPIWNYKYIDHVQITVSETLSADDRAGYYDHSGAMRDMIQNHIFQLMALVAMEPPVALDATSIRDEKVKVYRSIRPMRPDQIDSMCIRGQYGAGSYMNKDKSVPTNGYLKAKGVPPSSMTETFAAIKLYIDNWRWGGTPFYIRTGKCLNRKLSEATVRFRSPPLTLFQKQHEATVYPNDLIIRVQPEEGISWRLNAKVPGGTLNIKSVALEFQYKTAFHVEPPEAYERLIYDGMIGDQTLFIRADETEAAWQVIDPIEQHWAKSALRPQEYAPGSWGPQKSCDLIEDDGRRWIQDNDGEAEPIIACSL